LHATSSFGSTATDCYLANVSPPSASSSTFGNNANRMEDNAYILNLNDKGGYIDGCALTSQYNCNNNNNHQHHGDCGVNDDEGSALELDELAALDKNPSACGHLINHHATKWNVEVFPFAWYDVVSMMKEQTSAARVWNDVTESASSGRRKIHYEDEDYFSLPNELRADGSPWYYDDRLQQVIYFNNQQKEEQTSQQSQSQTQPPMRLCGAALMLVKPISRGEELLLNYGLKDPLPKWAEGWYK